MSVLRNNPKLQDLVSKGRGYITDYSGKHTVQLDWNLNEEAKRDKIFKLTVGEIEVYLDVEELLYYTRVM